MNAQILNLLQQQFAAQPEWQGNPQMTALMQALMEKQQQKGADAGERTGHSQQFQRLRQSRNSWKQYAEGLAETVRFFAEVFGACSLCWGQDSRCPHCHGNGSIGSQPVDTTQLLELIHPILAQAGLTVSRESEPTAPATHPTNTEHG